MIYYEQINFRNESNLYAYELFYFSYENIDSKKEEHNQK